jgi:hypothetical protein
LRDGILRAEREKKKGRETRCTTRKITVLKINKSISYKIKELVLTTPM